MDYARELLCGEQLVEVIVRRMRRKTMAIHVFPDRPVELRVPKRCSVREMEAFLESRREWIAESLISMGAGAGVRSPRYVDGELHGFLGEQYRLRLFEGGRRNVSLIGDVMSVRCSRPEDPVMVRETLEQYYRKEALRLYPERIDACLERFQRPMPRSTLKVRKMRSRWGQCSSKGEICLNILLVQRPLAAIDFVVTHELCHLVHFNHSKSFYRLMDQAMTDWREREKLLVADAARLQLDLF